MKYGIWRTEKRARFFRTQAGFVRCPISGKPFEFESAIEAADFMKNDLGETVGPDYEIRTKGERAA